MTERKKGSFDKQAYRLYSESERERYIGALVAQWEKRRRESAEGDRMPFVTISREFGCMALESGLRITEALETRAHAGPPWAVYDKEIVQRIAGDLNMQGKLVHVLTEGSRARVAEFTDTFFRGRPTADEVFRQTARIIRSLCERGNSVIIGRGGSIITAGMPGGFHVRIVAPFPWRVQQVARFYHLTPKEAEDRTRVTDRNRERLLQKHFQASIADPTRYDLVLNQESLPMDLVVDLIVRGMEGKGILRPAGAPRRKLRPTEGAGMSARV